MNGEEGSGRSLEARTFLGFYREEREMGGGVSLSHVNVRLVPMETKGKKGKSFFFFWVCVRDLTMATTKGIEVSYNVGPHLFFSVVCQKLEIRGGFCQKWRLEKQS